MIIRVRTPMGIRSRVDPNLNPNLNSRVVPHLQIGFGTRVGLCTAHSFVTLTLTLTLTLTRP